MGHDLVSPLMLSESGLEMNSIPKRHKMSPSLEDHSMCFKVVDMRIYLQLHGVFSYFPSCKPLDATLNDIEIKELVLTFSIKG